MQTWTTNNISVTNVELSKTKINCNSEYFYEYLQSATQYNMST